MAPSMEQMRKPFENRNKNTLYVEMNLCRERAGMQAGEELHNADLLKGSMLCPSLSAQ